MVETIKNAWSIPELRKKILFTILMIVIFRIGSVIPVPYIDPVAMNAFMEATGGTIFGFLDTLTGGAFASATIFALSITPYINASIIMQLLTVAIPALERLAKEGVEGRKKLAKYTRYLTVLIGLLMGFAYYMVLRNQFNAVLYPHNVFVAFVIILTFTAGTAFIMWLGEQITEYGIGNGISIILFAGIISRGPAMVKSVMAMNESGQLNVLTTIILIIVAVLIVAFVVFMTNAERRIPVQYAKRVVGRKMYGGQSTHIPLKVNMSGVLPIIFASSIVSLPELIARFLPAPEVGSFGYLVLNLISSSSWLYAIIYFLLIIFFNFFYVSIQFNPIEVANNLKKNGGFVPGIRPGKPTSEYISKILSKVIVIGAIFLGLIAVLPIFFSRALGMNLYFGGTSLLIVVGVALDTVKQMESQMLMRHYKGFLE